MKYIIFLLLCLFPNIVHSNEMYRIKVDLTALDDDKLRVEMYPPNIIEDEILFIFPKVVPGTYSIDNYGRFIENFKAYDSDNQLLKIEKQDINSYKIHNSSNIAKITYYVRDTWDEINNKTYVFQPSGTNFSEGKNFVLNNHALFGYFENYDNKGYEIEFIKPEFFYPSTSLNFVSSNTSSDLFKAVNYAELIDNPILYCIPDTISYFEGTTKITISVYSDSKSVSSNMIIDKLKPITSTVSAIFDSLPCNNYRFIYYFFGEENAKQKKFAYGALEHKNSSFYYIPGGVGKSIDTAWLFKDIIEMSSHEFMHIFSPLKLRSYEIADFNYHKPNMSKHLWLYEGVTEYLSLKVLLKSGLIDISEFISIIRTKITSSDEFKDISLTTISKEILKPQYQKQFDNFYDKGALLAFILDIELSKPDNENIGLIGLLKKLLDKYGDSPFSDNLFINEIEDMTNSEIDTIFSKYINGKDPIVFNKYFASIGLNYYPLKSINISSFGKFKIVYYTSLSDPSKNKYLLKPIGNSMFGRKKFFITKINGQKTSKNLIYRFLISPKNQNEVAFEIVRNNQTESLKLKPELLKKESRNQILIKTKMTDEQKANYNRVFCVDN